MLWDYLYQAISSLIPSNINVYCSESPSNNHISGCLLRGFSAGNVNEVQSVLRTNVQTHPTSKSLTGCPHLTPFPSFHLSVRFWCTHIQNVHFAGLLNVQNILSADTGISRQTEGDHLISGSVSVTPSCVIETSTVLCSVSLWLVWSQCPISLSAEHPIGAHLSSVSSMAVDTLHNEDNGAICPSLISDFAVVVAGLRESGRKQWRCAFRCCHDFRA
jgi:hypothetical protein